MKDFFRPFTHPDCYKDLFVMIFVTIWLITSLLIYYICNDTELVKFIVHPIFIAVFSIFVLMKIYNKQFNEWLNTKL